jgi:hypothetical protein
MKAGYAHQDQDLDLPRRGNAGGRVVRPGPDAGAACCLLAGACGSTIVATLMLVLPGSPRPRRNVGCGRGGGGAGGGGLARLRRLPLSGKRAGAIRQQGRGGACPHIAPDPVSGIGAGSPDGHYPSLLHNSAVGRRNPANLLAAMLHGVQRATAGGSVFMPGFDGSVGMPGGLGRSRTGDTRKLVLVQFGDPASAKITAQDIEAARPKVDAFDAAQDILHGNFSS